MIVLGSFYFNEDLSSNRSMHRGDVLCPSYLDMV